MLIGAPWPLASRDAFTFRVNVDELEARDRIIIIAHSLFFAGDACGMPLLVPQR